MQKHPLISFVVITHNRSTQLVKSRIIDSILEQNYPRKELILIGENCVQLAEIAQGLNKDKRLENFSSLNLEGGKDQFCSWALVARARNKGIELSTGEYISCQDDDNILDPAFCQCMLDTIKNEQADAAWCWRKVIETDGSNFSGNYFPWMHQDEQRRKILYRIWSEANVIKKNSAVIKDNLWANRGSERFSTVDPNEWLIHREVFKHIRFKEHYHYLQILYHLTFDNIWNVEFCESGFKAVLCPKPLLTYFLGGASNSCSKEESICTTC